MKTPDPTVTAESSALNSPDDTPSVKLNQRKHRAVAALLRGPVMREELDRAAGVSNGPALVRDLRALGLDIECELVRKIDRDGRSVKPGRYSLTERDRELVRRWGLSS